METKTCLNDVSLTLKDNDLILKREKGFFSLSTSTIRGGLGNVPSIIINDYDEEKAVEITHDQVTTIITPVNGIYPVNVTVLINWELDDLTLLKLFQEVMETIITVFNGSGFRRHKYSSKNIITVACTAKTNLNSDEDINNLFLKLNSCLREAVQQLMKNLGYPKDIIGHMEDSGVTITDLIDAGMQLCVGVERTEELDLKLEKQLLISLKDLNVTALIMAGIRLEDDLLRHRIRGINVDDDPAYLYSDEVLGMAVANQIAGTKALFNFKRYDEEKPGIIGTLGPVLDDIFAGLVAGCMSKIFEE